MNRLLSADRMRLRKSWFFWLLLVLAAALTVPPFRAALSEAGRLCDPGEGWDIDEAMFQFPMIHGVMLAAFVPLFLGADYSDGTIRNKLIAGHRRGGVYLSALLTCLLAVLCLTAVSLAATAVQAFATHGRLGMDGTGLALHLLAALCCGMAFASLYVLFSMLIPNRSYAIIACAAALLLTVVAAGRLEHALMQAEIAQDVVDFVDGSPVWSEPYPNPAYVSGWKRTVMELTYDFLPAGQGMQMNNLEADRILRFPFLSALFVLLTGGAGLLGFRKKDLK